MRCTTLLLTGLLAALSALTATAPAYAGMGLAVLPGLQGDGPVTVFYPTPDADQPVQRGPFTVQLAPQAAPARGNGRLVVVSFHSLEDRIVKQFLGSRSTSAPRASRHAPDAGTDVADDDDRVGVVGAERAADGTHPVG